MDRYGGEARWEKRRNVSVKTIRIVIGASSMARILIRVRLRRISMDIIYRHIVSNEIRMKLKKKADEFNNRLCLN